MWNNAFWTKITSFYGFQTSPVILCMQNGAISIRISSLQKSLGPLETSNSDANHVVLHAQNDRWYLGPIETSNSGANHAVLHAQHVSMGPRHHLSLFACNTVWLVPELLVSMGLSPHLWFLHAKQWLLDQNYKSLWVPDLTCRFCACKTAWLASE